MSTIRGVKDRRFNFVQLLNQMFEDPNLSLRAKGFIGYCLTKPIGWVFHISHLSVVLKEGRDAIYSIINECIENGYAYRYQIRDVKGKASRLEFIVSDSKEEIELIKKEKKPPHIKYQPLPDNPCPAYKSCEGKNKPHVEYQPLPDNPYTDKPDLSNRDQESNTEKQQQRSAAVFSDSGREERQTNKKNAEPKIYPILFTVEIPDKDRVRITRTYTEQEVGDAVRWATSPLTYVRTTMQQAIQWACDEKPDMPVDPKVMSEENKDYAQLYDGKNNTTRSMHVDCGCELVSLIWSCPVVPPMVRYDDKHFMIKFHDMLKKNNFKIIGE